jgi:hypothetical protein
MPFTNNCPCAVSDGDVIATGSEKGERKRVDAANRDQLNGGGRS